MASHPDLDLQSHESYEPQAIETSDDDLKKAVLSLPSLPLLDSLRSSSCLMAFEEILVNTVDKDYHCLVDQGIKSSLHPESLGLILSGQPIGVQADLTAEFEEASKCMVRETELVDRGEHRRWYRSRPRSRNRP